MEIQFLHLAGFKHHPQATDVHLSSDDSIILNSAGDELHYYFQVILGIIFGLDEIEKQEYRDINNVQIYTGLIHIKLDDRILVIERDFETDILACMLLVEGTSQVIFHDRDFIDNGKQRSYIKFLRRYLTITDKNLISALCNDITQTADPDLQTMLSYFYALSAPKIQIQNYKEAIGEYTNLLQSKPSKKSKDIGKQIVYFENQKQKIRCTVKAEKQLEQIKKTMEVWSQVQSLVTEKRNEYQQLNEILNQKFPLLRRFEGEQLRKEVIIWKELIQQKSEYDNTFSKIQSRIDAIEKNLNKDLLAYRSLPATFESDIQQFEEKSVQRKKNQATLNEIKSNADSLEKKFQKRKKSNRIISAVLPVILGFIAFFIVQLSPLLSVAVTLVSAGLMIGWAFYEATKLKSELWILSFEQSKLKDENNTLDQWMQQMRSKALLVEDYEKKDIHIRHHRNYRELKRQLDNLKAERESFSESWKHHDGFEKINEFNQKYGKLIDLKRADLNKYLENFAELKQLMQKYSIYNEPFKKRIGHYQRIFKAYKSKLMNKHKQLIRQSVISSKGVGTKELLDDIEKNINSLKKTSKKK